ncbi:REP-associated tyrosine transposase [Viridibacterium curvum]|uniref:Transposase n=1 Tax=Viridibacterium curvum TaxID=1101404 RepID=A0ABP9QM18_9RHOO
MSHYRRASVAGGSFFFTVVTYRRRPWLIEDAARTALRDAIERTREKHPFTIDAWVLMPDHLHCIWTLPANDADFSTRWALIKRRVSFTLGQSLHLEAWMSPSKEKHGESTLWQRRFFEHTIRDDADFERCANYIHHNPVKHGLVERVEDWQWSSFHRYVQQGTYAKDWTGDSSESMQGDDM